MGILIDQFMPKKNYNYGCNNYIPNYNSNRLNMQNFNNNNLNRSNFNNSSGRTPEAAFMGYNGDCKMYGLHVWDGNYN